MHFCSSNPRRGKLFIRNSSLKFGRDKLKYPAYFSYKPLKTNVSAVLPALTPKRIEDSFIPIMDSMINGVEARATDCRDEVADLLAQLDAVINYIDQCTFNTDASRVFKDDKISGAYNSTHFKYLVRNLGLLYDRAEKAEQAPQLALIVPEAPPFSYLSFQVPILGSEIDEVKLLFDLDDFSMQVLRDLARGNYQYEDFYVSGL